MRLISAPLVFLTLLFLPLRFLWPLSDKIGNEIDFKDIAAEAGVRLRMQCGSPEKRWIPEANGSGCAFLDYDNDGLSDLLIINGSSMEELRKIVSGAVPDPQTGGIYLFRNLGNRRFQDVTTEAGLSNSYWGTGANAADYNNDGYTDILITTIGVDLLYKNNGNGTFSEAGKAAGLSQRVAWHTGSAFGDYDNDGDLDFYVAGYVDIQSLLHNTVPPVCSFKGLEVFCGPRGLKGEGDILYHNRGNGTFTDVTSEAGVIDSKAYFGFSVVFDDFNGDGKIDLFVANDSCPNYLYRNLGNGTFRDVALSSGVAYSLDGHPLANMGVAVGDYDDDGDTDLLTTTFSDEYCPLFEQQRAGFFEEVSLRSGLANVTMPILGWGCGFDDLDNDGDKDLWIANGHVYPRVDTLSGLSYSQPLAIFENHNNRFFPTECRHLNAISKNSYRGAAAGDFDNDGKIDLVVLPIDGFPLLLADLSTSQHSWIGFKLRGHQSNKDAIGATIQIEYCGNHRTESLRNGGSYLSKNDERVRFGLGNCNVVDKVTIVWPRGKVQVIEDLRVNQYATIEEAS